MAFLVHPNWVAFNLPCFFLSGRSISLISIAFHNPFTLRVRPCQHNWCWCIFSMIFLLTLKISLVLLFGIRSILDILAETEFSAPITCFAFLILFSISSVRPLFPIFVPKYPYSPHPSIISSVSNLGPAFPLYKNILSF